MFYFVYGTFIHTPRSEHVKKFQVSTPTQTKKNLNSIQINHQLDAIISPVYYPDVYLQLNMFRASSRPSSGAQQLQ